MRTNFKDYQDRNWWNERVKQFKGKDEDSIPFTNKPVREVYRERTIGVLKGLVKPGWKVLDVGCSWGMFYPIFKELGAEYVGTDFCDEAIKMAIEKYDGKFLVKGYDELDFEREFDCVLSRHNVHVFGKSASEQKELFKKFVKPNGCIIIDEPVEIYVYWHMPDYYADWR